MEQLYSTYLTDEEKQLLKQIHHLAVDELDLPSSTNKNYHFYGWHNNRCLFWIHHYKTRSYFYMRQEHPDEATARMRRLRIPVQEPFAEDIMLAIRYAVQRVGQEPDAVPLPSALERYRDHKVFSSSGNYSDLAVYKPPVITLPLPAAARESEKLVFAALRTENMPTAPLDEEKIQFLQGVGAELAAIFESALSLVSVEDEKEIRRFSAYRMYFFEDATSPVLAEIFSLSRQGALNLARRGERTVRGAFVELVHGRSTDAFSMLERAALLVKGLCEEDLAALPLYAFPALSARRIAAIFSLLFRFPSIKLVPLIEENRKKEKAKKHQRRGRSFEELAAQTWSDFKQEIVYPADFISDAPLPASFPIEKPNFYTSKLAVSLQAQEEVGHIVQNPDLIYSVTTAAEYRPQLLLQLADGQRVLVAAAPYGYIAFEHIVKRARALHLFCKAHGYGYVFTDGKRSLYEYLRMPLDPAVVAELDAILEREPYIFWEHILQLQDQYGFSKEQGWAYVLQKRLILHMRPFRISRS